MGYYLAPPPASPPCAPCPANATCPGFLSSPVVSDPARLALPLLPPSQQQLAAAPPPPPLCSSLRELPAVLVSLTPPPFSFTSWASLSVGAAWAALASLALLLYCVSQQRLGARCKACLLHSDGFAASHLLSSGQVNRSAPTLLGGLCSLLSLLTLLSFALILLVRFTTANTQVVSTLNTAIPALSPFTPAVPFAAPAVGAAGAGAGAGGGRQAAAAASPPLPRDVVLQLRVFAQAELGCAAPTELTPAGLQAGAWEAASLPDCGDGRSLLVLSCTSCVLSAVASLTLTLPYTCQALHIEALAVDATGEVSVMVFPSHLAGAAAAQGGGGGGSEGELLGALQWTLDPMQALVVDTISATRTRGLRLLGATAASTRGAPAGGLLQPLSAAVVLTFALPLQSSFSVSTISAINTLPELVSSLIGLVGIVGAFRLLFQYAEYALERGGGGGGSGGSGGGEDKGAPEAASSASAARPLAAPSAPALFTRLWRARAPGAAALLRSTPALAEQPQGTGAAAHTADNPLVQQQQQQQQGGEAQGQGGAQGRDGSSGSGEAWTQHWDHATGETWYTCGARAAWHLPPGAALVADAAAAEEPEVWERHEDGSGDVWYSRDGATVWRLPQGAVVRGAGQQGGAGSA